MSLQSFTIPKKMEKANIEIYLKDKWEGPDPSKYLVTLKAFANVVAGKTGINISLDNVSLNMCANDNSNSILTIISTSAADSDRFKDAIKEYMKLVLPSLGAVNASFYLEQVMQYNY